MDEHHLNWRNKRLRCSICLWRGTWAEGEDAPRVQPADIDAANQQLQRAYEEKEQSNMKLGQPHMPSCPQCGHHLLIVNRSSVRPAT